MLNYEIQKSLIEIKTKIHCKLWSAKQSKNKYKHSRFIQLWGSAVKTDIAILLFVNKSRATDSRYDRADDDSEFVTHCFATLFCFALVHSVHRTQHENKSKVIADNKQVWSVPSSEVMNFDFIYWNGARFNEFVSERAAYQRILVERHTHKQAALSL